MGKIVIATRNPHKIREIKELLAGVSIEMLTLNNFVNAPEVVEDGISYRENALKKAKAIFAHTKLPTLADDSGIEAHYHTNEPGIHSARFAGPHATDKQNLEKLIAMMKGVAPRRRHAQYCAVVAFVGPNFEHVTEGTVQGTLITEPRGRNGFGYDPIFVPKGGTRTFAEISAEEKHRLSHRGKAIEAMKGFIIQELRP